MLESFGSLLGLVQSGTSNVLNSVTQLDWRKESISGIALVYDQLSGQSDLIQYLQSLQHFINNTRTLRPPTTLSIDIELVLVHNEYRKQGIGTMMMEDIVEYSRINQMQRIDIYSTQECFKKLGFEKYCPEETLQIEEKPLLIMSKVLKRYSLN